MLLLVLKLQPGNAPVPEALASLFFRRFLFFDSKQGFDCNPVPKPELGNEANANSLKGVVKKLTKKRSFYRVIL